MLFTLLSWFRPIKPQHTKGFMQVYIILLNVPYFVVAFRCCYSLAGIELNQMPLSQRCGWGRIELNMVQIRGSTSSNAMRQHMLAISHSYKIDELLFIYSLLLLIKTTYHCLSVSGLLLVLRGAVQCPAVAGSGVRVKRPMYAPATQHNQAEPGPGEIPSGHAQDALSWVEASTPSAQG